MQINRLFYLRICLKFCLPLSYSCALFQHGMSAIVLRKVSLSLKFQGIGFKNLCEIWYARIVRRLLSVLVRTPLIKGILGLVEFNVPVPLDSGCVIVTCHTPWKRLLVQWCLENNFALVIGGGKWTHHARLIQRQGAGVTELRGIVKYLQQKGRVILAADFFNTLSDCPVSFIGNKYNASTLHVRLARMAGVPLMVVIPKLNGTSINFTIGPHFECTNLGLDVVNTTQSILSFLEKEIEGNPSIWSYNVN